MRLLSIGRPLPHRQADNATIFTAPALHDAELLAIDPAGVLEQVQAVAQAEATAHTASELAVRNGADGPDALGLAELMQRRREELAAALGRGACVVVFLCPTATIPGVAGFQGADRYWLVPAPAGAAWDARTIRWAEGRGAVVDAAHPFAAAVDAIRPTLLYRARLDEHAPGLAGALRPFARSTGGAVIGAEVAVGGGRVVFLPTPADRSGDAARPLAAAIVEAGRELLGGAAARDAEPAWAREIALPGLDALETAEAEAASRAAEAAAAAAAAQGEADAARALRGVLWAHGRRPTEAAAVRCLEALGFRAVDDPDGPRLRAPEGTLYLEAEGGDGPVGMAPHYRLRRRLDALLEAEGTAGRGLVVAAGEAGEPPARRARPYIEALATGAEATRYALIAAPELFDAARYALTGPGEQALAALRGRLLAADGPVTLDLPRD